MSSAGAVLAELVGSRAGRKNPPVFGACMRFMQVSEHRLPVVQFAGVSSQERSAKAAAAGLCPAKLCGKMPLPELH